MTSVSVSRFIVLPNTVNSRVCLQVNHIAYVTPVNERESAVWMAGTNQGYGLVVVALPFDRVMEAINGGPLTAKE